jgi:hypothetical protein
VFVVFELMAVRRNPALGYCQGMNVSGMAVKVVTMTDILDGGCHAAPDAYRRRYVASNSPVFRSPCDTENYTDNTTVPH